MGSASKQALRAIGRPIVRGSNVRRFPDTKFPVDEAVRRSETWWDRKGRHLITNKEWRDPDVGIPSGITRGLTWAELTDKEKARVVVQWHHEYVRAPMVHQGGLTEGELREMWAQTQGRRK